MQALYNVRNLEFRKETGNNEHYYLLLEYAHDF